MSTMLIAVNCVFSGEPNMSDQIRGMLGKYRFCQHCRVLASFTGDYSSLAPMLDYIFFSINTTLRILFLLFIYLFGGRLPKINSCLTLSM